MKRHALLRGTATLGLFSLLSVSATAQVSITPIFTNAAAAPSPLAQADIINALNRYSSFFSSPTPFNLTANITFDDEGPNGLGGSASGASSFQNEGGILYVNPLDRFLFGDKPGLTGPTVPGYVDFDISINNNPSTTYDYTLGTPANSSDYSLASVIFHEAAHSMGFLSDIDQNGAFAFGAPNIWNTFMTGDLNGTSTSILSMTDAQRAHAITVGESPAPGTQPLLFNGPNAEAANGGNPVTLFAPTVFVPGSSDGSHIAYSQPGAGLLYPTLNNGVYLEPTRLELSTLADIGWRLTPASVPEPGSVALLMGMTLSGAGFLARRRRKARTL